LFIVSEKEWFKNKGINLFHIGNAYDGMYSAPIVERLNRTFKNYMYDLKEKNKKQNWNKVAIDTVKEFPNFYNNKVHKTTKLTPNEIYNGNIQREEVINDNLERANEPKKQVKNILKVGDMVRLQIPKKIIEKKLEEKYYKKPYKIIEVKMTNPITYKLEGLNNSYYYQQLIKV
jgi:hypothetical protein